MNFTIFGLVFFLLSCKLFGQEEIEQGLSKERKSRFELEGAMMYDQDLKPGIIGSSGMGSRLAVFNASERKFHFGIAADWRIIPSFRERIFTDDLKNLLYTPLSNYHGQDSITLNQLYKVLGNEPRLDFNGYIKGGLSLAVCYDITKRNAIRGYFGILNRQFRTTGNESKSNPYGDPGYYWLNTGVGYSIRGEYLRSLNTMHLGKGILGVKLILGLGFDLFKYSNFKYNDVSILKSVYIEQPGSKDFVSTSNIHFGIALYRK